VSGRRVVVVGGGLAGITAAVALRESGAEVTLLEARPRLGGATCSFRRGELVIDNGQHVFLRCCAAYRGLLAKLGTAGEAHLQDRFDVTVLSPSSHARLRRSRLPGPLHLAGSLLAYRLLSPAERVRVARAALALSRLNVADPSLDAERLGPWLAARGQDERTRRALWDLFTVASLNIAGDDANLALAATVFQTGLLGRSDAADIGTPGAPLGELHGAAAARLLRRLGAEPRVAAKVAAIAPVPGGGFRVTGTSRPAAPDGAAATPVWRDDAMDTGGGAGGAAEAGAVAGPGEAFDLRADGVVLAVPADAAARLVPPGAVPGGVPWAGLGFSPIVNVHVVYDRRVTRLPFAAAVDSPVQWVFDRTGPSGLRSGQYLAVSLSAADGYAGTPAAQMREQFLPALAELFPAAAGAGVTDFFVTRERRATFRQTPGCGRSRAGARTAISGLVLAGAWTDTGWPDTMEGAVRSGLNAARELRAGWRGHPPARPVALAGLGGAPSQPGGAGERA